MDETQFVPVGLKRRLCGFGLMDELEHGGLGVRIEGREEREDVRGERADLKMSKMFIIIISCP